MSFHGWKKVAESKTRDKWQNTLFPIVQNQITGKKYENVVEVVKTAGGWWQVWASSAPLGEIASATSKTEAVRKAVKFMRTHPKGHSAGRGFKE